VTVASSSESGTGFLNRLSGPFESDGAPSVRTVAGGVAAVAVLAMALLRAAVNSPLSVPGAADAYPVVRLAALALPALAALAVGVRTDDRLERVGLSFAGVFCLLATVSAAATVPAAGAVVAGGGLAVATRLDRNRRWLTLARAAVVAAFLLAATLALGESMGVFAGGRTAGTTLALLGLAALPVTASPPRAAWAAGGTSFALVVLAGAVAPFVTGAVVLVEAAVVGAPLVLVALGVGGGVAAATTGAVRGNAGWLFGGLLLLAAGVPATVPRALAVVLGLGLVVGVGGETR